MQEVEKIESGAAIESTSEIIQDVHAEEAAAKQLKVDDLARKVDDINDQKSKKV
jgi:hypothetical protein